MTSKGEISRANVRYWQEKYGIKSKLFVEGLIEGVRTFAVWKDGVETVGVSNKTLKSTIEEIRKAFNYEN